MNCCLNCKFWKLGACRRYPPKLIVGYGVMFPTVGLDEWCGEYSEVLSKAPLLPLPEKRKPGRPKKVVDVMKR